jgi:hypothetical protein
MADTPQKRDVAVSRTMGATWANQKPHPLASGRPTDAQRRTGTRNAAATDSTGTAGTGSTRGDGPETVWEGIGHCAD